MTSARLSASLIANACLRAAAAKAQPAAVLRRGDPDSGVVYVKVLARDRTAVLYVQTRDAEGEPAWTRAMGGDAPRAEADVDLRLEREAKIDPDLWVVEVLDDSLAHPLEPKLV